MKLRAALLVILLSMPGLFGCSAAAVNFDAAGIAGAIINIESGESQFAGAKQCIRYNSSTRCQSGVGATLSFHTDIGFVDVPSSFIWGGAGDNAPARIHEQELNIKGDQNVNWFNELMVKSR